MTRGGGGLLPEPDPEPDSESESAPDLDPPVPDVPAESAEPAGRRYPSTLGGMFYLVVLAVSGAGLVLVSQATGAAG